jgi:hypothetical protein
MPARFYTSAAYTGSICISGAGSTLVNGTYTFSGYITDGPTTRPSYQKVGFLITLVSERYYIQEAGGDNNGQYLGNTFPAPANPYLETSWTLVEAGVLPYPVITQGPC